MKRILSKTLGTVTIALGAMIAVRFLLKLAGANTIAPFVVWVYELTDNLMKPFRGIFPTPSLGGKSTIDIPALTALAIYLGGGYGLTTLASNLENSLRIKSPSSFFKDSKNKKDGNFDTNPKEMYNK